VLGNVVTMIQNAININENYVLNASRTERKHVVLVIITTIIGR